MVLSLLSVDFLLVLRFVQFRGDYWIQSGFMVDPFGLMNDWTDHRPDKRM